MGSEGRPSESFDFGSSSDAWPFYVVCDVSQSMWHEKFHPNRLRSPHYVMNSSFPGMMAAIDKDISARHIAHVGVIAFSDSVRIVTPLSKVSDGSPQNPIYQLPQGGETDYAQVFRRLDSVIRTDTAALSAAGCKVKGPAVFFLTDGEPQVKGERQPDEVWLREYAKLTDKDFAHRPRIIALGLGDVREKTLALIASKDPAGAACVAEDGATPADLLQSIIDIIIFSVTQSAASGSFVFDTPEGMRRVC